MVESQSLEIKLLIEAIFQKYGYDFSNYADSSFRRRLSRAMIKHRCKNIADILHRILTSPQFFSMFLNDLTVTVTEMFRDPSVFKSIRENVVPYLRTYPEIKLWFAGCAGGEEVYSMAILLKEEGLYDRSILYGTDINLSALKRAKAGIVEADSLKDATRRYFEAGGKSSLHSYYSTGYGSAVLHGSLKDRLVFSDHNLVSDQAFGEMQLIFCRNALIYFKKDLHDRAIGLLADSLCSGGFLCLGSKESLVFSAYRNSFEEFLKPERVYRKKGRTHE